MARNVPQSRSGPRVAPDLVCLGEIVGAHGVKGALRVKSYAAVPTDLASYGPLTDAKGERPFTLSVVGETRGAVIARIEGITDRDAAEALKGTRLHVPREALPEPGADSYYHVDLIGLEAVDVNGSAVGRVAAVHDLPAGDVLEIRQDGGGELMLPFTRAVVPRVDIRARRLVVDPPGEVEA